MFRRFIQEISYRQIIIIALIVRVLSVIFSKGYGFNDDHFEVMEVAQNWLDGVPFVPAGEVYIFSLLYPGLHYILFGFCEWLGIFDPEIKMWLARIVHAGFSMLTVIYGYKLSQRLSQRSTDATIIGLLLATFWVFPFMAVRNLREFFCVPALIIGCYYAVSKDLKIKDILLAAGWFAVAFIVRYQVVFVPMGIGLVWLLSKKNWTKALLFGIVFSVIVALTQGLFDYLYWGNPVASMWSYAEYNAKNSWAYPNGPWYQYIGTVAGLLLAPACLLLVAGYFRTIKNSYEQRLLFIASALLFGFHSYFPNKQERFILPFLPFIIILGVIGFQDLYEQYAHKSWFKKTTKALVIWFLALNTLALVVLTFTYSKQARVEAMTYLRAKGDVTNIIMEGEGTAPPPPIFYLQKHIDYYEINAERSIDSLKTEIASGKKTKPNYLIMAGNENFDNRLKRMQGAFAGLKKERELTPSLVDNIAFKLNPKHNQNEVWIIYKID
jgi:hypothetical protein